MELTPAASSEEVSVQEVNWLRLRHRSGVTANLQSINILQRSSEQEDEKQHKHGGAGGTLRFTPEEEEFAPAVLHLCGAVLHL